MLGLVAFAAAFDEPPVADVATVAFNPSGTHVAIETRWVEEGPGFPNAALELRDTATGALLGAWSERLVEARAMEGMEGASVAVRAEAAAALSAAGVNLDAPATAVACAEGRCGPPDARGGCARARDELRVTVTSTPTDAKIESCYGRGKPHLLGLSVQGRAWATESVPRDGCPSSWRAEAAWLHGESVVVLLGYDIPGHEGVSPRRIAVVGKSH